MKHMRQCQSLVFISHFSHSPSSSSASSLPLSHSTFGGSSSSSTAASTSISSSSSLCRSTLSRRAGSARRRGSSGFSRRTRRSPGGRGQKDLSFLKDELKKKDFFFRQALKGCRDKFKLRRKGTYLNDFDLAEYLDSQANMSSSPSSNPSAGLDLRYSLTGRTAQRPRTSDSATQS